MAHRLLYGGTFDPVHHGHLIPCRHARELLGADGVTLMPARISPHKAAATAASAEHRLEMLRLAIEGEAGFTIDGRELTRPGPSYTIDTLRELIREAEGGSGDRFTLLIGADQLALFGTWREVKELLKLVEVGVLARPGTQMTVGLEGVFAKLGETSRGRIRALVTPLVEISATEIRQRVGAGMSIRYLVPEGVAEYIAANALYQTVGGGKS